jgi:hypothetical protein
MHDYSHPVATQELSINVAAGTNAHVADRKIVEFVAFYAMRVISKESKRLVLSNTSCFGLWIWSGKLHTVETFLRSYQSVS